MNQQLVIQKWREVTQKIKRNRNNSMLIMYRHDEILLRLSFQSWRRLRKRIENYNKLRDHFYKKLLIFNYKYIISKYFRQLKNYHHRTIEKYYRREKANRFRSQRLQLLLQQVLYELMKFVQFRQNAHVIEKAQKQKYLKLWHELTLQCKINKGIDNNPQMTQLEKWIQELRSKRSKPKSFEQEIQNVVEKEVEKIEKVEQENNQTQSFQIVHNPQVELIDNMDHLKQYLEIKVLEYEFLMKLPNRSMEVIKSVKQEIKQTLERMNQL